MPDFLLEIGCEELPAAVCSAALSQLAAKGEALLAAERLGFESARVHGTPRRLAWLVLGLTDRQPDAVDWVRGPSRAVAFDAGGQPTRAATGFAAGQGVAVADLELRETHVFARRLVLGRSTGEVLAGDVPDLVASLEFPRSMRWGSGDFRFARPIRWLVALLGDDVVECGVAGVQAGRVSYGQRTLHPGAVEIGSPAAYEAALRAAYVMVDRDARKEAIRREVQRLHGRLDEGLLDEVTDLVEWPKVFVGGFEAAALELPEAVLVTVMRVHQRYFPVEGEDGRLVNAFIGVRNGGADDLDVVRAGNEKVLRARLADARFFYEEDRKEALADRVRRLASIAFAPGLGDMLQKAERLRLATGGSGSALLCKADRLTHLVYEFPELEGTMGGHYARLDGEDEAVAQAIEEHVLPRAAGDELPTSPAGRALALADRFDNLVGHFALGRVPTGSADPHALRRQALAVLRILEHEADASLGAWIVRAQEAYRQVGPQLNADPTPDLRAFLAGRLAGLLREAGYRYDIVDAVLAADCDDVAELWRRAAALAELIASPVWDDVVAAYRRAANLAAKAEPGDEVRAELFEHEAEGALAGALALAALATANLAPDGYAAFYQACARLRPAVDAFLEAVLVMAADPQVRQNRLRLLRQVATFSCRYADLGRLTAT